jgi:site-specific recombinase XerD
MHAAVEFYLKFHEYTDRNPKTFTEVFDLFYAKSEERKLSQRYYQTLRHHRNFWEPEFGTRFIDTITPEEYLNFLKGPKYSDRSKHNLFGTLSSLLRFARKQRFIADDKVEIEANFGKLAATTPEYYTPEELCRLFIVAPRYYLPYLALMAFGGTRSAEASHKKLKYQNVLFDEKMIRLGPEITKTRTGRTLDISDNLAEWLKEFGGKPEESIFPRSKVFPLPEEKLKAAGVTTKSNALRHSFCSYHLALNRSSSHTAEVAGNSPKMLNEHYKALVSRIAAQDWFAITPEKVRCFAKENSLDELITW